MRTEVYTRRNITALFRAVLLAQAATTGNRHDPQTEARNAGFTAAVLALAAGCDIEMGELTDGCPGSARGAESNPLAALLLPSRR